jgi:hypothetical protein
MLAIGSAVLLSWPWILGPVSAAAAYESALNSYFPPYDAGLLTVWTGIAINQVLLGLLAAAGSKKPPAPAAQGVPAPTKWLAGVFAPLAIFAAGQARLALSVPADRWDGLPLLTWTFAILAALALANSFVVRMQFRKATHVFLAGLLLPAAAGLLEYFLATNSPSP